MEKLVIHTGVVAPLMLDNVDTDAIIPKQYMKSIRRTGFGPHLFDGWRYLDQGEPGVSTSARIANPNFLLNEDRYRNATILLTGRNFGCGSSREHAPWALQQFGFRVLMAVSYAEIFSGNCLKNGLLPLVLPESQIHRLAVASGSIPFYQLKIDLQSQTIFEPNGEKISFDIHPFNKHCLLNGLGEIELTLRHTEKIKRFENVRLTRMPWLDRRLE